MRLRTYCIDAGCQMTLLGERQLFLELRNVTSCIEKIGVMFVGGRMRSGRLIGLQRSDRRVELLDVRFVTCLHVMNRRQLSGSFRQLTLLLFQLYIPFLYFPVLRH